MNFSNGDFRPVAPDVFVATCEPAGVNIGLVIGAERALLVDTGASAEQGAALFAAATEISPVPVSHAVITHSHWDHWFGLSGMPEVTGLGHDNLPADAGARRPEERFHMVKAIDLGELRVEFLHFGEAHTTSDVMVWISSRNVCFTGDLVESSGDPQFSEESNIRNWPTVLDGILGASNDETVFVPGHGDPVDRDFVFRQRAEIDMLYSNTESLIQRGVKLADAAGSDEWPFTAGTLESALPLIYAELEARGIQPRTHLPLI